MSGKSYYAKSAIYEDFLKKAYNGQVTFRHGVDKEYMKLLMEAESNIISHQNTMSYQMQLKRVKKYMQMAIEKMLLADWDGHDHQRLLQIKHKIDTARNSAHLLNLCYEGLEATKEAFMAK